MRLVVLGASGGCGQELVRQASAAGHTVVAVGRERSALTVPDGVEVRRGSLDDERFLREAFRGADGVLSALGLKLPSLAPWAGPEDPTVLSRCVPVVLSAMKAEGVGRIVAISAGGVGDSLATMPWVFRALIRATALRTAYAELEKMEALLASSGLDWCCPRPTGLTDGPATGAVREDPALNGRATISRSDVAAWMLARVRGPSAGPRAPVLTVTGAG